MLVRVPMMCPILFEGDVLFILKLKGLFDAPKSGTLSAAGTIVDQRQLKRFYEDGKDALLIRTCAAMDDHQPNAANVLVFELQSRKQGRYGGTAMNKVNPV